MIPLPPQRPLSRSERLAMDEVERYRAENPRRKAPCFEQTKKQIEDYYRTAPEGSPAAVRHTQAGCLRYVITTIGSRRPSTGRVNIEGAGDFYMKSGVNCFHPKGQTTLVVPTDEVVAWARQFPQGSFDHQISFSRD